MAKKKIVEEQMTPMELPSDNIVTSTATGEWALQPIEAMTSDNMAWFPPRVVDATTIPEKPKVDVNKVLFEMIALLGTVDVFESQARIMRAVAAFYNLTEDMS